VSVFLKCKLTYDFINCLSTVCIANITDGINCIIFCKYCKLYNYHKYCNCHKYYSYCKPCEYYKYCRLYKCLKLCKYCKLCECCKHV